MSFHSDLRPREADEKVVMQQEHFAAPVSDSNEERFINIGLQPGDQLATMEMQTLSTVSQCR